MPKQQQRKSGGSRKIGRCKEKCARYRSQGKFEKAHIRKIKRHLKRFSTDLPAVEALKRFKKIA